MASNSTLVSAKAAKNDEFYTLLSDIEKELKYYKKFFKDKVVYCNCDTKDSNFFKYFAMAFEHLGLKKLIATGYNPNGKGTFFSYEGDANGNLIPDDDEILFEELEGNGDFRSSECEALLMEADIVVTNPPFSLFRDFIAQLIRLDKKFLVIGNTNAVKYKEIFPYIKENKMWVGVTNFNVGMMFVLPDNVSDYHHIDEEGRKIGRVSTSCWWTNIQNRRRNEVVELYKKYTPEEYPKYDNYDAIECGQYTLIPEDYDGIIGVPITFIGHYNPEQFEIVGEANHGCDNKYDLFAPILNGKQLYPRLLIRRR